MLAECPPHRLWFLSPVFLVLLHKYSFTYFVVSNNNPFYIVYAWRCPHIYRYIHILHILTNLLATIKYCTFQSHNSIEMLMIWEIPPLECWVTKRLNFINQEKWNKNVYTCEKIWTKCTRWNYKWNDMYL